MKILTIYTSAHVHFCLSIYALLSQHMCTFVSAFINFCLSTDTSVEELRETTEALQKAAVIHGSLTFPKNQHFNAACTIALLILIIYQYNQMQG